MSATWTRFPFLRRTPDRACLLPVVVAILANLAMCDNAATAPFSSTTEKCGWLIEKAAEQRSTAAGSTITYHVRVTRTGEAVRGGRLQDSRGEGTASYGTVHQGTVASGGGNARSTTFELGPLGTGETVEIIYDVKVESNLSTANRFITNYVQLDLQGCHVSLDHVITTGPPNDTKGASPGAQTVSEPIDAATGEYFTVPTRDLFLGGPFGLGFSRYYASGLAEEGAAASALGGNWRHNYDLALLHSTDILRTFVSERGQLVPFVTLFLDDEQAWTRNTRQEAVPFELQADEGGNLWLLDPLRQMVYRFDEDGVLQEMVDRNHNRLTFTRDRRSGRIEQVGDGLGRTLNYTYAGEQLRRVSDGTREVALTYDRDDALASVTDVLGGATAYAYDVRRDEGPLMTARTLPLGNVAYRQTYDDAARVVRQTDPDGNATLVEHATPVEGRTRVTEPSGAVRTFTHVDGRMCTAIEDPAGNTTTMTYDDRDRLVSITDRLGDTTTVTYHEPSGHLASYTDALGHTTTYAYGTREQTFASGARARDKVTFTLADLVGITYPDATSEAFTYDERGNVVGYRDRAGGQWTHTYNERGQPVTATTPTGGTTRFTYHPDATIASRADDDAGVTTYGYDAHRRLSSIARPDGSTARLAHDAADRLVAFTDPLGRTTRFDYDANNNLVGATDPLSASVVAAYDAMDRRVRRTDPTGATTAYAYDTSGRLATVTDRNGHTLRLSYDVRGWLDALTDGSGGTWTVARDAEGVTTGITSPLGHVLAIESDALGRPTAVTDPTGAVTRLAYDAMGRVTTRTDRAGRTTTYAYDPAGRLVGVTAPGLGTTTYARNGMGRLSSITDPRGQVWQLAYTALGRARSHTDPLGNQWTYGLDGNGRLGELGYPDGTAITITYDAADQVVGLASSGGRTLRYASDDAGRLVSTDGLELAYDPRGDVVESREPGDGLESRFGATYDAGRRVASLDYDGQTTVHYEYDARNLPLRVSDEASGAWLTFAYDADGRLGEIRRSNGVLTTISHDAVGRVTGRRDTLDGRVVADQEVTLDAEGNPVTESRRLPLPPAITAQLAFTATFDAASRPNATGYASDARGRQTATPRREYTYDDFERTIGIKAGGATVALDYNGLGLLSRRTANGVVTSYHRSYALPAFPVVAESTAGAYTRWYVRAPDGSLLYSVDPGTKAVSFYHFDRVGSTLFLTDGRGEVTDAYAYEPYGVPLAHTGASDQPFTFAGRYGVRFEPVGAVYQMGARLYDPDAARFLTRDAAWPVPADPRRLNPYAYAHQNPLRFIDPAGAQAEIPADWMPVPGPSTFEEAYGPLVPPFPGAVPGQTPGVWYAPGPSTFEEAYGPLSGQGQGDAQWLGASLGNPTGGGSWQPSMSGPLPGWQQQANPFPFAGGGDGLDGGAMRQSPGKGNDIWPTSPLGDDWGWGSTDPFSISTFGGSWSDGWGGSWDDTFPGDGWSFDTTPFSGATAGGEPLWLDLSAWNAGPSPSGAFEPTQLFDDTYNTSWELSPELKIAFLCLGLHVAAQAGGAGG